ncbi:MULTISPECIES: retropepsin-like aspartic protease family protein [Brevundimonas]|uniref:retropepsin-like aspartic protease family protein n=1 Tax=Brevundimonas TaxID=41275 RepID=UPI000F02A420|nr:TIGR02281 family clan AA aspartic protease [Brevundimonas lutea]
MVRIDLSSLGLVAVATSVALLTVHGFEAMASDREAVPAPVVAVAAPAKPATGGVARVDRADDGHYWAEAEMDGRRVRLLVDTGASTVALTRDDALRLGHRLIASDFDQVVHTAGGETRAARVRLRTVSVDGVEVAGVEALVVERGLKTSLLGMSYLGRLSKIEATPDRLTLTA